MPTTAPTKRARDDDVPHTLTFPKADDFHHHLRDGDRLPDTVMHCSAQFRRAICMPNLNPPVTTAAQAKEYKARIYDAHRARGGDPSTFDPLMTLYLTELLIATDAVANGHGVMHQCVCV